MQKMLFAPHQRVGYSEVLIDKAAIKATIFQQPEFTSYTKKVFGVFDNWKQKIIPVLKAMDIGVKPKKLIHDISEDLLKSFSNLKLIDKYDVYQHLMSYWSDVMQDDVYVISDDGWQAGREVYRIKKTTKDKNDKTKEKEVEGMEGIESKLLKPGLLINRYFADEKKAIEAQESKRDNITMNMSEMEEEHGSEDGLMADAKNDKEKITAASVKDRLKEIKGSLMDAEECKVLEAYLKLSDALGDVNKQIKTLQKELETKVWDRYKLLTDDEIKVLVVDDKWIHVMDDAIHTEMQRISQRLTQRIKELAERYETPLPLQLVEVKALEEKVNAHLSKMGFVWN